MIEDILVSDLRSILSDWSLLHPDMRIPHDMTVSGLLELHKDILRGHFDGLEEVR